ncbi:hypothetical protein H310_13871 [Aphanomyces invadans]|uniref:Uncharacterized protein n=1 Tax=Aphanomyces invadans TaxID=157072 RepID=A0A024TDF4_9STRA|nr:hypothetical protein H310_13871 [Aphanomyces invadans]ETV91621.1 hypothetical protein H310_13871 [Aphanomyces invadans]|eukprot:XP_008879740.1 hypothetical protein H310_13871 [Aphanomyces invadans]
MSHGTFLRKVGEVVQSRLNLGYGVPNLTPAGQLVVKKGIRSPTSSYSPITRALVQVLPGMWMSAGLVESKVPRRWIGSSREPIVLLSWTGELDASPSPQCESENAACYPLTRDDNSRIDVERTAGTSLSTIG